MSRLDPDWATPIWAKQALEARIGRREYMADWSGLDEIRAELRAERAPRTIPVEEIAESFAKLAAHDEFIFVKVAKSRWRIERPDAEWSDAAP